MLMLPFTASCTPSAAASAMRITTGRVLYLLRTGKLLGHYDDASQTWFVALPLRRSMVVETATAEGTKEGAGW